LIATKTRALKLTGQKTFQQLLRVATTDYNQTQVHKFLSKSAGEFEPYRTAWEADYSRRGRIRLCH
jgi:hypothetical protein